MSTAVLDPSAISAPTGPSWTYRATQPVVSLPAKIKHAAKRTAGFVAGAINRVFGAIKRSFTATYDAIQRWSYRHQTIAGGLMAFFGMCIAFTGILIAWVFAIVVVTALLSLFGLLV